MMKMKLQLQQSVSNLLLRVFLIGLITSISRAKAEDDTTTAMPMPIEGKEGEPEAETGTERTIRGRYIAIAENAKDAEVSNSLIPSPSQKFVVDEPFYTYNQRVALELVLNSSKEFRAEFRSVKEMAEHLETWEAPEEIRKKYPYYLSGRDEEGRPIWTAEFGRWDLRSTVEVGGETLRNLRKYIRKFAYNAVKSFPKRESTEDVEQEIIFICDFDQLSLRQVGHIPTLTVFLQLVKEFEPFLLKTTFAGFVVNANYVAERLIGLLRPILGALFERIEVYGANSAKWIPHLGRRLPRDQLPSWYGGAKEFKPVAVYG